MATAALSITAPALNSAGTDWTAHPLVRRILASFAANLHAKLAFMVENQMSDGQDWLPELWADAARLAKLEG